METIVARRRRPAGTAGHQVARRHAAIADAPAHRSPQLGEFEIKRGLTKHGLVRRHGGLRIAKHLRALLEYLLADGALAHQLLAAGKISFGKGEIGPCAFQDWRWLGRRCSGTAACRW